MRAELPWNIAGIPPEAREAARAAARREGLSVGEWLTRRILRSFSDMGEDPQPLPVDPWGLPPSSASRRDSDDMLARVSRSESESSDVYRRIEDQLRNVARRLDGAERSQSESNRVMNKTATEINITSREQAQAFDQLGGHVMGIGDRLERLERNAAQDGLKDAVKALHQGLSRLADQITQTATQSATQVSSLAGNLEQLAARLGQARAEAEAAAKTLDSRIAAVEKAAQFTTNALDHALEKLEAQATIRAGDLSELQKRDTATEVTIMRLEESIGRLEKRESDPVVDRRLDSIERSLGGIVTRLDHEPVGAVQEAVRALGRRLDGLEKDSRDALAELRAKPAPLEPAVPTYAEPVAFIPDPPVFEAPPFAEPVTQAAPGAGASFDPSFHPEARPGFDPANPNAYAPDTFADAGFEMPADFAEALGQSPVGGGDNFLNAARRSARAAADAESERGVSSFRWGKSAGEAAPAPKPRRSYMVPLLILLILVVALITGVMLSQRLKGGAGAPIPDSTLNNSSAPDSSNNIPPPAESFAPPNMAPFVPAPQVHPRAPVAKVPTKAPSAKQTAPVAPVPTAPAAQTAPAKTPAAPATPPASAPAAANANPSAANSAAAPAPFAAAPAGKLAATPPPAKAAAAAAPGTGTDRVMQLADAGNPIAETIVGLKLLDGTGVAANPAEAAKWLQKAADKGQAVAQYRLGTIYERGQGVAADPAKAAKWYMAAANLGNRKAMHNLAVAYADGALGKKDMAEAARWFSKAAALGLSDSQFNLAVLYERGDGVPQSLLDAFKWYSIAAVAGDAESKSRLAVLTTQLSDTDRAAAQKSAATFHATALNRSANVPPEAADLPAN